MKLFKYIAITTLLLTFATTIPAAAPPVAFIREKLATAEKLWPGQRISLYITLYTTSRFMGSTRFELPKVKGLLIMEDEDRPLLNTEVIDGVSYVTKRHELSLFPQQSGKFTLPPFTVAFAYRDAAGKSISKSYTTSQHPFSTAKIPGATVGKPLITASTLEVKDNWQPVPMATATVGDAFTRVINITANDLPGMAIPPLSLAPIPGLAIYDRQPHIEDKMARGDFTGIRTQEHSYVCERQGKYTIPAMTIQWWNPKTEVLKEINLAEVQLKVAANPLVDQAAAPPASALNLGQWLTFILLLIGAALIFIFRQRLADSHLFKNLQQLAKKNFSLQKRHKYTLPNLNPWRK